MRLVVLLLALMAVSDPVLSQEQRFVSGSRDVLGTESNRSASLRAGDLDGDGDLDLVVANGRHWPQQNYAFFNQGRARFNVARRIEDELATSYACELGDLNGDGVLDLVVGNDNAPSHVLLGDGSGRFVYKSMLCEPTSLRSLTIADVDRDGHLDILMTCRGRPNQIFFNDGAAGFDTAMPFGSQNDSTIAVAVADINQDNVPDLILANRDNQPNVLLLGRRGRAFSAPVPFGDPLASSRAVVAGDFNSDKHVDWAVVNIGDANTVFLGDGKGGVLATVSFGPVDSQTYALAAAHMNKDGRLDIVACNAGQSNAAYLNEPVANNAELLSFRRLAFGLENGQSYGCAVGDFDGDGDEDIAVANSDDLNRVNLNLQP